MISYVIGLEDTQCSLQECLQQHINVYKHREVNIRIVPMGGIPTQFCRIELDFPKCASEYEERAEGAVFLANGLSDVILEDMQSKLIRVRINTLYGPLSQQNRDILHQRALVFSYGDGDVDVKTWRTILRNRLEYYLLGHQELIIDGFIRFRMRDLIATWEKAIKEAAREMLMEKEYQEFIKLLQYFVETQPTKCEEVHVLMEGRNYVLLDQDFRVIDDAIMQDVMRETVEQNMSSEDMLISALIGISPKSIIIHNSKAMKNNEIMETVSKVFAGKVKLSEDYMQPTT